MFASSSTDNTSEAVLSWAQASYSVMGWLFERVAKGLCLQRGMRDWKNGMRLRDGMCSFERQGPAAVTGGPERRR